jgi:enoyl-CoA hydratase
LKVHEEDLYLERTGEVATLVINRPRKRNAITYEMWQAIPDLVREAEEDTGVKVLLVRGADASAFSAGADIGEFEARRSDSESARIYNEATHEAERALDSMQKPTIAMVQGPCIGGGCGVALACDLRISDTSGRFGITPAKLGLVYSLSATKQLVDLVGPAKSKYILFSGRQVDARRAYEIGLVDQLYEPEEVEEQTWELAEELCSRAQFSVRSTKHIIRLILSGQAEDDEETVSLRNGSFDTEDYQEGVRAFLDKRPPNFTYS